MLGKNLQQRRIYCGLTQRELAEKIGSTQAYVSMIESQTRTNVSLDTLKAIAKALDWPLAELLHHS
jgi:transcriptional regulator with XRE-family HTH domain